MNIQEAREAITEAVSAVHGAYWAACDAEGAGSRES